MAQQAVPKDGPVDAQQANGAQIPLSDFCIPQFPREAGGLIALTLTSLIKPSDYETTLHQPFTVTHLPPSIQSLTLEQFWLGYPPGFLAALIKELPELRTLVLYSQSFAGNSAEAREDAVAFFEGAKRLRALHLLDCFTQARFIERIAPLLAKLEKHLMFLEVNYTNQPENDKFLETIQSAELPLLVSQGLISCSLNMAAPEISPANGKTANSAIQTVDREHSEVLVKALLEDKTAPRALKLLNTTMYLLSVSQLEQLLSKHKGLLVLCIALRTDDVEGDWRPIVLTLLSRVESLEQVEIVLSSSAAADDTSISIGQEELSKLSQSCKKLESLKMNVLRGASAASVACVKAGEKWEIKVTDAKAPDVYQIEPSTGQNKKKKKERWSAWT